MTTAFKSYREESRGNYGTHQDADLNQEQLRTGAMLRIADASEKMALRHTELMEQRDRYENWYYSELDTRKVLERRLAASKGQITKLKKALAAKGVQA